MYVFLPPSPPSPPLSPRVRGARDTSRNRGKIKVGERIRDGEKGRKSEKEERMEGREMEEEGCKGDGSGGEVGRHGTRAT